jgi:hypothetical protein
MHAVQASLIGQFNEKEKEKAEMNTTLLSEMSLNYRAALASSFATTK